MAIPSKVKDRLFGNLKKMLPIILQQKDRDVSEADTVTLVKDLMSDVFGYDKYVELTSEHAIRGTYCDLCVKLNDKLVQLIEVKSAGSALDDRHVKQAVDYASNSGTEWVVLTNGSIWRLYQVIFGKPIDKRLLLEMDLANADYRKDSTYESLYMFCKEGFTKGAHIELRDKQDATSRFTLAALILENESVRQCIRRELRRVVDVLVDDADIVKVLKEEVIKRDVLEGPEATSAARRVNRQEDRPLRSAKNDEVPRNEVIPTEIPPAQ